MQSHFSLFKLELHFSPFLTDALISLPLDLLPEALLNVFVKTAFVQHLFSDLGLEIGVRLLLQLSFELVVYFFLLTGLEFLITLLTDLLLKQHFLDIVLLSQLVLLVLQSNLVISLHGFDFFLEYFALFFQLLFVLLVGQFDNICLRILLFARVMRVQSHPLDPLALRNFIGEFSVKDDF